MSHLMQTILKTGLILAVAVSTVSIHAASAQETAKKGRAKKKASGAANPVFAIPSEITLSAEQQEKLDAIKKEQGPKIAELTTKVDSILTGEQKSARKEANAKAKSEGKKGKEARAMVEEALKLTDEQKKQRAEFQPELAKLQKSIKEQIYAILTDEQKTHYKLPKAKKA